MGCRGEESRRWGRCFHSCPSSLQRGREGNSFHRAEAPHTHLSPLPQPEPKSRGRERPAGGRVPGPQESAAAIRTDTPALPVGCCFAAARLRDLGNPDEPRSPWLRVRAPHHPAPLHQALCSGSLGADPEMATDCVPTCRLGRGQPCSRVPRRPGQRGPRGNLCERRPGQTLRVSRSDCPPPLPRT